MSLKEEFEEQGTWLFCRRSYLPLLLFPLAIVGLAEGGGRGTCLEDIAENAFGALCVLISFSGLLIRCLTIGRIPEGTSRRSTEKQIAETLNTTGIYSIVRHPLYLGNFVMFLGVFLFIQVWWFVLLATLTFFLYYERIMYAEEEFLRRKHGNAFVRWAKQTPAFLPRVRQWSPSPLPFSFRNVLQREYSGFFAIVASFTFFEAMRNFFHSGNIIPSRSWFIFFLFGLLVYLILLILRKRTRILSVEGR